MRVALFTETFLPKVDGIVNTLVHLLDHLELRGHETLLFAPQGSPKFYGRTRVIEVPGFTFPLYPELQLAYPWYRGAIPQILDGFEPDVVHLLGPVACGLVGLRHARALGIPTISSYHTDLPGFAQRWGLSALSRPLWSALRAVHNQTERTLAPSVTTQDTLVANGFDNVEVWTRGVDTALFNPGRRSPQWRERLTNGNPDAPLLLYVGRLSKEKRVDWLRPVMQALPNARLAVVGEGPFRAELEAMLPAERTVFTGYLHGEDLASAYASGDVFVFPGANETFGNVVLEAMSAGVPVVVPRSGGVLDFVRHGETGMLFDTDDPSSLVQAVVRLAREEVLWQRLRAESRRVALSRSWAETLDELVACYYEVAGIRRQRRLRRAA